MRNTLSVMHLRFMKNFFCVSYCMVHCEPTRVLRQECPPHHTCSLKACPVAHQGLGVVLLLHGDPPPLECHRGDRPWVAHPLVCRPHRAMEDHREDPMGAGPLACRHRPLEACHLPRLGVGWEWHRHADRPRPACTVVRHHRQGSGVPDPRMPCCRSRRRAAAAVPCLRRRRSRPSWARRHSAARCLPVHLAQVVHQVQAARLV